MKVCLGPENPRGGRYFDELAKGQHGYAVNHMELSGKFADDVQNLYKHVKSVIGKLEKGSGKTVESFVIGKTTAKKYSNHHSALTQEEGLHAKWRVASGPGGRWKTSYADYGYDGLVNLAAVTGDILKSLTKLPLKGKEQYALALEQALSHKFVLEDNDVRCDVSTFAAGKISSSNPAVACVYMAYSFATDEPDDTEVKDEEASFSAA